MACVKLYSGRCCAKVCVIVSEELRGEGLCTRTTEFLVREHGCNCMGSEACLLCRFWKLALIRLINNAFQIGSERLNYASKSCVLSEHPSVRLIRYARARVRRPPTRRRWWRWRYREGRNLLPRGCTCSMHADCLVRSNTPRTRAILSYRHSIVWSEKKTFRRGH
jgi:hypothetical protein